MTNPTPQIPPNQVAADQPEDASESSAEPAAAPSTNDESVDVERLLDAAATTLADIDNQLIEATDTDEATEENIDDKPAEMTGGMGEQENTQTSLSSHELAESSAPEITDEDKQLVREEIDEVTSEAEQNQPNLKENEPGLQHPAGMHDEEQNLKGTQSPKGQETTIETQTDTADDVQLPTEVARDAVGTFPLLQRILVKSLTVVNRPFNFIPEKVKNILGIVAVVTGMVTIIAVILLLFIK